MLRSDVEFDKLSPAVTWNQEVNVPGGLSETARDFQTKVMKVPGGFLLPMTKMQNERDELKKKQTKKPHKK